MPKIVELRILPPFAIGRLGSAEQPMDNYTIEVEPDVDPANPNPLGYRKLTPLPTLIVGPDGGIEDASPTPTLPLQFKHAGKIRPVAPFLEVFAKLDGADEFTPLTRDLLRECGLSVENIRWSVCVANRKVVRRTGDERDSVVAVVADVGNHEPQTLKGRCANFRDPAKNYISFGKVQFIRPTDRHPEIRLRFTPGRGLIYGPPADGAVAGDHTRPDRPYGIKKGREVYDPSKGGWKGLGKEKPGDFYNETLPPSLFAIDPPAPTWLNDNVAISRGYFDDACDGFVEVRLSGEKLDLSRGSAPRHPPSRPTRCSCATSPTTSIRRSWARRCPTTKTSRSRAGARSISCGEPSRRCAS
jgi:hypothetical protein